MNIIEAMKEALEKQQQLSVDMIHRFLDETEEEMTTKILTDSTRRVLGDAVTLNYKNIPIRTKTIGQKKLYHRFEEQYSYYLYRTCRYR